MPTDPSPASAEPSPEPGPDASAADIQADIEATRDQLGETVAALTNKADVTGRAKQKVADTGAALSGTAQHAQEVVAEKTHQATAAARNAVTDETGSVKKSVPVSGVVAIAVVAAVIGVVVWRRR